MLPQRRAVRRKRRQDALRALHIDVTRLAINRRARGGIAQVDGVAQVIIVEMLPELPARFGVETGHSLLQVRPLARVSHRIQLAVRDYGGRLPREIRPPQRLFRRNAIRQAGLPRIPGLLRPAPAQPAARGFSRAGQRTNAGQHTPRHPQNSGEREGSCPPSSDCHLAQYFTKHFT